MLRRGVEHGTSLPVNARCIWQEVVEQAGLLRAIPSMPIAQCWHLRIVAHRVPILTAYFAQAILMLPVPPIFTQAVSQVLSPSHLQ